MTTKENSIAFDTAQGMFLFGQPWEKKHALNEEMAILSYHLCLKLVWRSEKMSKT